MSEPKTEQGGERRVRQLIAFSLSMPSAASWNGKWSGAGRSYFIVRSVPSGKASSILDESSFYYRWQDGWTARIAVIAVNSSQGRKLRAQSEGFCGYDWMVDSIINHGKIYADHEIPQAEALSE